MAATAPAEDAYSLLLDSLDLQAKRAHPSRGGRNSWECQRRSLRHPFRTSCTVHFLPQASFTVTSLPGRTRNISRGGVALITRRVFRVGEPVEVEAHLLSGATMYLAGLVTFCRYAGRGYHELGVKLEGAGHEPIFSHDPANASERLDWLRTAQLKTAGWQ